MQGREAAVAKSLGSSQRPLIRKQSGVKIETANSGIVSVQAQNTFHREISTISPLDEQPSTSSSSQQGQEPQERRTTAPEGLNDAQAEATKDNRSSGFASLVAAYSDSDSDSTQ